MRDVDGRRLVAGYMEPQGDMCPVIGDTRTLMSAGHRLWLSRTAHDIRSDGSKLGAGYMEPRGRRDAPEGHIQKKSRTTLSNRPALKRRLPTLPLSQYHRRGGV